MAKFGDSGVDYNVKVGEDIRVDHNNNPDKVDMLVGAIKESAKGFARGLTTDLVGLPSDIYATAMRAAGLDVADENAYGSQHLRRITGQPLKDSPEASFGNIVSSAVNAPAIGAGKLFGVGAGILLDVTRRQRTLANELSRTGANSTEILDKTGVKRSPIGTMRREIVDSGAYLQKGTKDFMKSTGRFKVEEIRYPTIDKVLSHDLLYKDKVVGKQMRDTKVVIQRSNKDTDFVTGEWSNFENTVYIKVGNLSSSDDVAATLLHELQHKAQDLQGLERGANSNSMLQKIRGDLLTPGESILLTRVKNSSPNLSNEELADVLYWATAGEVEARAVARRYKLLPSVVKGTQPSYNIVVGKILARGEEIANQKDKAALLKHVRQQTNERLKLKGNVK